MARRFVLLLALIFASGSAPLLAEEELNAKAAKVYRVLLKRPAPGYLFDRFYNAWLDTGSLEGLEAFLQTQISAEGSTSQRLLLAFFYAKQRSNVNAIEQFRTALAKDPGNAAAWFEKATIEARTLDFKTAIADLERAAAGNPKEELSIEIAKLQGRLLLRDGNTEAALKVWQSLLAEHPDDEDLREDLIEHQVTEGLFAEAIKTSEALISQTKDVYQKVIRELRLGDIHHRAGDREKALTAYSGTLERVGADTWIEKEVLSQIDRVFRREEDLSGLNQYLKTLIETHPKRIGLRKRYADLLIETNARDEAVKVFDEILKRTPGDRQYREAYVAMLATFDQHERAVDQQKRLTETYPDDGELLVKLAELYHAAKKPEETETTLRRFLSQSDQGEYAYLRVARLFERYLMTESATAIYEELTNAHPDSQAAREAQAAFLHKEERREEALAIWRGMAEGAPRSELVRLARLLTTRHEQEAAFELLHERLAEFRQDPIFLGELCQLASTLNRHEEALPWARTRVERSISEFDLEDAIRQFAKLAERSGQTAKLIEELKDQPTRRLNETCLLADLLEREGDSQGASKALASLESIRPEDQSTVLGQQIRLLKQRHDWLGAAELMEQLIALPGARRSVHVQKLIELYQEAYQWDEAIAWIVEWKKLSPGSVQPWLSEARILNQQEKSKEAIEVLRAAVQQFEGNEQVRSELAMLYTDHGKYADASRMYWSLYEEAQDVSHKLNWVKALARTARLQGKLEGLVSSFEERRQSNRSSILPLLALAEVHRTNSNYEKRRAALLEATRLRPDDVHLLLEIARIEESEGKLDAALRTLESALPLDKTDRTRRRMVQLHLEKGDDASGFQILHDLAGGANMGPREAESLAETMIASDHYGRAIEFLAPFVEQHPNDYRLGYLHALALEEDWRNAEATEAFLRLLSIDQELPSGTAVGSAALPGLINYQERYMESLRREVPAPVVRLIEQTSFDQYRAYSHRQQRSRYSSFYGLAGGQRLFLPSNLEKLPKLVVPHLAFLRTELEEGEEEALRQALRTEGFHFPSLSLDSAGAQQSLDLETILTSADPDDRETLEGFWVLRGMDSYWRSELALRVFERYAEPNPSLAIRVAMHPNALADEGTQPLLPRALTLLDQIEKPAADFLNTLARVLNQSTQLQGNGNLSEGQLKVLTDRLIAWYPELNGPQKSQIFHTVATALRQADDLKPFFTYLEEELNRLADDATTTSPIPPGYGRPRSAALERLTFPPSLPEFPEQIMALIIQSTNQRNRYYGNLLPIEPDKLLEHYQDINHPVLRCLVAYQLDDKSILESLLKELLAADDPTLTNHLLAAAHAGDEERLDEAINHLIKASYLPMDRESRAMLDRAILSFALDATDESPARKHGKDAALRLRNRSTTPESRALLADTMRTLGMTTEAEQLEANASSATGLPGGAAFFGQGNQAQVGRVEKLIGEDRFDQAIKTGVQELNRLATTYLSPQNMQTSFYEARRVVEPIRAHGLKAPLLKAADPGETASARRLGQFAMVCQIFDEPDRARELFAQVLKLRPHDEAARMRLFLLTASQSPKEAAKHLLEIRPQLISHLGAGIQEMLGNTEDFDTRLAIADVLINYLENLKDPKKVSLQWVVQVADQLAQGYYYGEFRLAPLLYRMDDAYRDESFDVEAHAKLAEKRRLAYQRFCQAMSAIPQLSIEAFRRLSALPIHEGKPYSDFRDMAKEALLAFRPFPGQFFYHHHDHRQIRLYNPDFILLATDFERQNFDHWEAEIFPTLIGNKRSREARSLVSQIEMLTCPESEFAPLAKEFLRSKQIPAHGNPNGSMGAATRLVDLWKIRKADTDLTPVFIGHLETNLSRRDEWQFIAEWAEALQESAHPERSAAFLNQLAEVFLGPEDEREAFVEKHFVPNRWNTSSPNGKIHMFINLVQEIGRIESLTFLAVDLHERCNLDQLNKRSSPLTHFVSSSFLAHPEMIEELYRHSPWLEPLERFRFYPQRNRYENATFFGSILMALADNPNVKESKERIEALAKGQDPPTFGSQLVLATLSKDNKAVVQVLAEASEAILDLPRKRQAEIGVYVRNRFPDIASLPSEDPAVHEFLTKLHASQADDPVQAIDDYIEKTRKPQTFASNFEEDLRHLFLNLFRAFPHDKSILPKAHELFETALGLFEKRRRSGNHYSSNDDGSQAGRFLYHLSQEDDSNQTETQILFILDRLGKVPEGGEAPELEDYTFYSLGDGLKKLMAHKDHEQRTLSLLEHLHSRLSAIFGQRNFSHLNSAIPEAFGIPTDEALDWLTERQAEDPVAKEMLMALRLGAVRYESEDKRVPDAEALKYYASLMADVSRPLTWRIALAHRLFSLNEGSLDRPTIETAAQALSEAWADRKAHVLHNQAAAIIEAHLALEEHDDAWETTSKDLTKAWLDDQLKRTKPTNRNSTPNQNILIAMLELGLASHSEATLTRLVNQYGEALTHNPRAFASLVRHGDHPRARTLFSKGWQQMEFHQSPAEYDQALDDALPQFLGLVTREDLRLLAQTILQSLPDPDEVPESLPTRKERLGKLATHFSDHAFTNKVIREKCLILLAEDYSTHQALIPVLEETVKGLNLAAIVTIDNSQLRSQRIDLVNAYVGHSAAAGNTKPFVENLTQLRATKVRNDYYRSEATEAVCEAFLKGVQEHLAHLDPADSLDSLLPALRQLAFIPDFYNEIVQRIALPLALHYQANQIDAFDDAFEALAEKERKQIQSSIGRYEPFRSLKTILPPDYPVSERYRLAYSMVHHPIFRVYERDLLSEISRADRPEVYADVDAIVDIDREPPGRAAAFLAKLATDDKELELAIHLHRRARKGLKSIQHRNEQLRLEGELLCRLARQPEALLTLASFEDDPFDPSKSSFKSLQRAISKAFKGISISDDPEAIASNVLTTDPDSLPAWRALAMDYGRLGEASLQSDPVKSKRWLQLAVHLSEQAEKRHPSEAWCPAPHWIALLSELDQSETTPLIEKGATWRYLDDGSNQRTIWRETDFDDSAWSHGAAPLGYGNGNEKTVVESGPDKAFHATTYFRTTFDADKIENLDALRWRCLSDDGVILYLNGQELHRYNIPAGKIPFDGTSSRRLADPEEGRFIEATTKPFALIKGTNVLAAEVHQANGTSSDLSLDLELAGIELAPLEPSLEALPPAILKALNSAN